jgi:CheY-like chemotaxis protein
MSAITNGLSAVGRVLVVDDEVCNRELLRDLLETQGYFVAEAESGREALMLATQVMPHVILLDVMMPGMDGFEVCRQLKASAETAPIPVLMVTALDERDDRLRGIEAGASDFLAMRIDSQDILLRTRNAVYAKQLYDRVQESYRKLQDLEQLRDGLVHMVVHDMRSPLMGITGNLEILETCVIDSLAEEDKVCLKDALGAARRLVEMVSSMLDVSRLETGQMPLQLESCTLRQVAAEAVKLLGGVLRDTPVVVDAPQDGGTSTFDPAVIRRVFFNLLGNAA